MQINPDANIAVAAVYDNGVVRIYDSKPEDAKKRLFLRTLSFSTYGKALLFAKNHDERQRRARAKLAH